MTGTSRIWAKSDLVTALLATLISLGVYVWSAAPNVTLLDSGEFIVAAQHFGVPHPTGYPLWTFLSWIFQLVFPWGNAAWKINIFSGVCASLAVGLCAALLSNIQSWCFDEKLTGRTRFLPNIVALGFSLMLAFSQSMWSQAVIAEVYALHALLIGLFVALCYAWVRNPGNDKMLLWAFFVLSLAFSNHQLTVSLAPLPYLLILLLRRESLLDWLFAGLLTLLCGYTGFAFISNDEFVLKTALRFSYCVLLAFLIFFWIRRLRIQWKIILFLPVAVGAGLLPYAYMPLASSTNPPMNWGYTREADGFFYSFNRSQYSGSLSDLSLKSLGRLMGSNPQTKEDVTNASRTDKQSSLRLQEMQLWTGFFWQQLVKAFTPFALIGYFASFLFVFRFPLPKRVWIYLLHFAFVLAAFLQPLTAEAKIDNAGWWLQMPYHTYTFLIFAILSGLGIGLCLRHLINRRQAYFWVAPICLILPLFTFQSSEPSCSQRNNWLGWMFGHDMLNDLPKGSVMIGGTDPGRFVPTYMIFGESGQDAKYKRDPAFDRRDLYIITQNALGDPQYAKYLDDHYTARRPEPKNAFERWLGREDTYPEKPLILPSWSEIKRISKAAHEFERKQPESERGQISLIFGDVLKWIWEKNRDQHEFFIEESFPIKWTYDYAVPHGLVYRLNKTKLDSLSPEVVASDFAFWEAYKQKLLSNPAYKNDFDAQRSFSKLRQSIANIYRHRKMEAEAERAYREAIELWPGNGEAIASIIKAAWDRGDFNEVIDLFDKALITDPNNPVLLRYWVMAVQREELEKKIADAREKLEKQPKSRDALRELVDLYGQGAEIEKAEPLIIRGMTDFPEDADLLRFFVQFYKNTDQPEKIAIPARQLTKAESSNADNFYILARALADQTNKPEFYQAAKTAIELGGLPVRGAFAGDPIFAAARKDPEFKKIISPQFPEATNAPEKAAK